MFIKVRGFGSWPRQALVAPTAGEVSRFLAPAEGPYRASQGGVRELAQWARQEKKLLGSGGERQ